ncbi:DUF6221 family protein [Actinomadura rubrisoli]|uniref:Uncharacterized protein n=1 Tax=Actinomadura rubrisoli TaxID=2530368 RepID=A0A4R5CCD8_9ACTN|nr:DUF6221 family protein [Actinomadura rubrisoli]TDD97651.1 hypothetical protein E1298_01050 [Actinomadura rubrisoli]
MDDLVRFLNERLDEDAALAQRALAAAHSGAWRTDGILGDLYASYDDPQSGHVIATADKNEADVLDHAARHDPDHVLADVEAKRRIFAEHPMEGGAVLGGSEPLRWRYCATCHVREEIIGEWPCTTMRLLTLPYADHRDYRDEWRP